MKSILGDTNNEKSILLVNAKGAAFANKYKGDNNSYNIWKSKEEYKN